VLGISNFAERGEVAASASQIPGLNMLARPIRLASISPAAKLITLFNLLTSCTMTARSPVWVFRGSRAVTQRNYPLFRQLSTLQTRQLFGVRIDEQSSNYV
jgi:hypothetical protein